MPTWNATTRSHRTLMNAIREFANGYAEITYPITYAGTGDGPIEAVASPPPGVSETWTLVCTLGGGHGVATFSVTGSVSGLQTNVCTVGTFYESDLGEIEFVIQDGPVDFVAADQFDITVTQSSAVTLGEEWTVERWEPPAGEYLSTELSDMDFPQNAFNSDGNSATKIATSGIIGVRLAGAVEVTTYGIRAENVGFVANEAPAAWTFQYSDDGVNWTTEDSRVGQVFAINELKTFAVTPGRHLYYRLNISANNGGTQLTVNEFYMQQTGSNFTILSEQCLILRGQGLSGTDNIYIGYQNYEDLLNPYANIRLSGFIGYEATDRFVAQPGKLPDDPALTSNDEPLEYWLTGTGRYIHCTTKVLTDYLSCYLGLLLPYSQPLEYSYPLAVMGTAGSLSTRFTDTSNNHRQCFDPGDQAGWIREPGGNWQVIEHYSTNYINGNLPARVWPWGGPNASITTINLYISDGIDFTQLLTPALVAHFDVHGPTENPSIPKQVYGEVQDVYHVSGSNNTPESLVTIGPDTFICFQNIFRTTFRDFYAVRLVP